MHDDGIGTPPSATRVLLVSMRSGVVCAAELLELCLTVHSLHHVTLCDESSRWGSHNTV